MTEIKKYLRSIFNKKKHSVFLLFVLCTSVFWFINKLSKDYNQVVKYNINYTDLPQRFVFQVNPVTNVSVRIHTAGFYFFKKAFKRKKVNISLNNVQKKKGYDFYLLNSNILKQIRLQVKDRVDVVEVLEDSLFFKLGKRSFKKIPVVANISVNYHPGYKSFDGVKIIPDSIKISGPEMQLAKITKIDMEPFIQEDVKTSVEERIKLIDFNIPKIDYKTSTVKLKLNVEKITEKTLVIPIQIVNNPKEEVVVYPKKIKLSCQVRLSQFNKIKESDFIVVCDYNKRGTKFMNTQLIKKPKTVSSIKLQTNKVEYLILK